MKKNIIILIIAIIFCIGTFPTLAATTENSIESIKKYELYGENNVSPDNNKEWNTKRNIEKLKEVEKFKAELKQKENLKISNLEAEGRNIGIARATASYSVTVPYHKQETTYWCGPASGQQTIDSWISENKYSGSLPTQTTLASDMETTSDGTSVYSYRNGINDYLSDYYATTAIENSTNSKDALYYCSVYDYSKKYAITYLVIKNVLPYYSGTSASGHFISGSGYTHYDGSTTYEDDTINLMDCHYSNPYAGAHLVDFDDLFEALYEYNSSRGVDNLIW